MASARPRDDIVGDVVHRRQLDLRQLRRVFRQEFELCPQDAGQAAVRKSVGDPVGGRQVARAHFRRQQVQGQAELHATAVGPVDPRRPRGVEHEEITRLQSGGTPVGRDMAALALDHEADIEAGIPPSRACRRGAPAHRIGAEDFYGAPFAEDGLAFRIERLPPILFGQVGREIVQGDLAPEIETLAERYFCRRCVELQRPVGLAYRRRPDRLGQPSPLVGLPTPAQARLSPASIAHLVRPLENSADIECANVPPMRRNGHRF